MTAAELTEEICRKHGITPAQLRGLSTTQRYVNARRDFIARGAAEGWSAAVIGRLLNRDHSTVLFHIRRMGGADKLGRKSRANLIEMLKGAETALRFYARHCPQHSLDGRFPEGTPTAQAAKEWLEKYGSKK